MIKLYGWSHCREKRLFFKTRQRNTYLLSFRIANYSDGQTFIRVRLTRNIALMTWNSFPRDTDVVARLF